MKKILTALLAVAMLSFVSCSSKEDKETTTNSEQTTTSNAQETSEIVTNTQTESTADSTVANNSSGEEKDTVNWWGIKMYCPDEYWEDTMRGFPQYYIPEGTEHLRNMVFYTYEHSEVDTMDAEAVKNLMYENYDVAKCGLSAEYNDEIIKENEVQKEEKVTVNGSECIRQEGILHCDDLIEPHDYFYVAYFGVLDFPDVGKQPAMIMAFTHRLDEESKAEIIRVADTAAQNAAPLN